MLRPIPQRLLRDVVTIKVCTGVDEWQNPTWDVNLVKNVHIQASNETRKTVDNTEVVLRSLLFIDCRRSKPALDYVALAVLSQSFGKPLRAVVGSMEYEVLVVDAVPDVPSGRIHHYELGLV